MRLAFHCQIDDSLTDVSISVHDLRNAQPLKKQVVPVLHRGLADLVSVRWSAPQFRNQLIQEQWNTLLDVRFWVVTARLLASLLSRGSGGSVLCA